jgi:hypothetical protein
VDVPHVCRSGFVVFSPPGVSDYYGGIDWLGGSRAYMIQLTVVLLLKASDLHGGIDLLDGRRACTLILAAAASPQYSSLEGDIRPRGALHVSRLGLAY